jgi:hypothetical protein
MGYYTNICVEGLKNHSQADGPRVWVANKGIAYRTVNFGLYA